MGVYPTNVRTWSRQDLQLLEHAPDAVIVVDENGAIIFANSQTETLFGYEVPVLLGEQVELLIPQPFRDSHRERRATYHTESHARPMGARLDLVGLRKDGVEIPVDISLSPILTDEGKAIIAAVRDISDRKGIENDLRSANRRLRHDQDAAAQLQRSLLPTAQPKVDGLRTSWIFEPCERMAGDSFSVFAVDDARVGIYLLDVSGHGVVAALQAVALTRVLSAAPWPSTMLRLIESPAEVVSALNGQFPINPETWQYFTFLCAIIDIPQREIRYATAGHPGPVLLPAGNEPRVLHAEGFPIGLFPDASYEEYRVALTPGDRVYFYSDGVTDAMDEVDEPFGSERLLELLVTRRDDPLETTVSAIGSSVAAWATPNTPQNDVSIVGLELTV